MDLDPAPASAPRFVVPTAAATASRRPGLLTAAAWLLILFGALGCLIGAVLLTQERAPVQGAGALAAQGTALVASAMGGLELLAGVMVLRRRPAGRTLGFVFAGIGGLTSIARLPRAPGAGLIGLSVAGFVIYALVVTGHHFRPRAPR